MKISIFTAQRDGGGSRMRRLRLILCGVIALVVATVAALYVQDRKELADAIEKDRMYIDYSTVNFLGGAATEYFRMNGSYPETLAGLLGVRSDLAERGIDSYGRDLGFVAYSPEKGFGELVAYGRDGSPGGVALDQDLVIRFPLEPNAEWNQKQRQLLPTLHRRPG